MTITIAGVTDLAGNVVASSTTHFTTASGPVLVGPTILDENPYNGATSVPLNAVVSILVSAPVDPATVNSSTLSLSPGPVQGSYSLGAGGQMINFVPTAPLKPSTSFTLYNEGITDLEGNLFPAPGLSLSFTTGTASDTVGPTVLGTSPANGSTLP